LQNTDDWCTKSLIDSYQLMASRCGDCYFIYGQWCSQCRKSCIKCKSWSAAGFGYLISRYLHSLYYCL